MTTNVGGLSAEDVLVQEDGKLVVVGGDGGVNLSDITLVRYLANGTLDPAFGSAGIAKTDLGGSEDARAVAGLTGGKLVVAAKDGSNGPIVLRYHADGALDTSFGEAGVARLGELPVSSVHDLALQGDGRIVLAGRGTPDDPDTGSDMAVVRLLANGSLDTDFGAGGAAFADPGFNDDANAVAVQADGAIVAAGSALARFLPDGSPDPAIGPEGWAHANPPITTGVALQPDGKIVLGGTSGTAFAAARVVVEEVPEQPADTTPPVLTLPSTLTRETTSAAGAVVSYAVAATDDTDPNPAVACSPPSGSTFPRGETTVTCTATDAAGNRAAKSFTVVVTERATVVILIQGIDPAPNYTDAPTKDPWTALAAPDVFGPVLSGLGCTKPIPASRRTTLACEPRNLYWAAYSYAGIDSAGVAKPFRGADTHQPLATSAARLQDLVAAVRRERGQGTNVVVIGFSLGGTVAARWASAYSATDVPVITLTSPVYGMWPDARNTRAAEDFDWYCNPLTGGELAKPFADDVLFQALCPSWPVSTVSLGPLGFLVGGYRSPVSYDWRTGVFTGPAKARDLLLLNVGNRRDVVAPVFWEVSPDAAAVRLAHCTGDQGHGCVKALPEVVAAVARVVAVAREAAETAQRPSRTHVVARFNEGVPDALTRPAQLNGYSVEVRAPAAWTITAIGERVVTYGATAADDSARTTCLAGATVSRVSASRVRIRWSDWRPHSLVVRFRLGSVPVDLQARARVVPADDAPGNTYVLSLTPLPGGSAGVCAIP